MRTWLRLVGGAKRQREWRSAVQRFSPPARLFILSAPGPARRRVPSAFGRSLRDLIGSSVSAFFTVSLAALPALALGAGSVLTALRRPLGCVFAAAVLVAGLVKIFGGTGDPSESVILGNYLAQRPISTGNQLGPAAPVLPDLAWWSVIGVALIAGSCLAGLLAVRGRSAIAVFRRRGVAGFEPRSLMLVLFGGLAAAIVVARSALGGNIYDRYLIPVLAVLLVVVLRWVRLDAGARAARMRAGAALGLSALLTLVFVLELRGLERGRWDAGVRLVNAGFSPREVDAGLEWVGFHYPGPVGASGAPVHWRPPDKYYLNQLFNSAGNCTAVSTSRRTEPWMKLVGVERYPTLLGLRDRDLYLYRNRKACRSAPTGPGIAG